LILLACGHPAYGEQAFEFHSEDLTYESRRIAVHSTFVRPDSDRDVPVVLMAHGHGGTRDEAGGFRRLAEELARRGIASLRMDFSGSGDSTEPFVANRLTRMITDLRSGLDFVRSLPGIDGQRTAVVGYSMGARVAMLGLDDGYAAAVLWAPVGSNGPDAIFGLFGGADNYRQLRNVASSGGGYADFSTPWGQQQRLSCNWFGDMDGSMPLAAIGLYPGPVLVIQGDSDPIIPTSVAETVVEAAAASANVQLEIIPGADHGLGFYSGDPAVGDRVIELTTDFLVTTVFRDQQSPDADF
jgi:dienelactone hydrolase